MELSGYLLTKQGGSAIYKIPVFVSGIPSFVIQLWGGVINRDRTAVLMSLGSRVRNFRGRHGSWRLVHHHRMGGSDYCCSVGGARGILWETFHGVHTELRSSKDVKHNLGHNV